MAIATGVSFLGAAVVAAGTSLIWTEGPGLTINLLIVLLTWLIVAATMFVPQIAIFRVLARQLQERRVVTLIAAALVLGGLAALLARYLTPWSLHTYRTVSPLAVGVANCLGALTAMLIARHSATSLGVERASEQRKHSDRWLAAYLIFWLITWLFGRRDVRAAEAAHWQAELPAGYWVSSSPRVVTLSRPLGSDHHFSGHGTIKLSSGWAVGPFLVMLDSDITGGNTGFDSRAFYVWSFGSALRILGPGLSVWN
jgi:hypothetical protein